MVIHTKEKTKLHIKAEPEAKIKGRNVLVVEKSPKIAGASKADSKKVSAKEEVRKSIQKESGIHAQNQKAKQNKGKGNDKKNSIGGSAVLVGTMTALDKMDGGNEVYESYMVAKTLTAPVESATNAGRRLYRSQVANAQARKIKKVQTSEKIGKKTVKESATKATKYTTKKVAKETAKETAKVVTKETAKATAKVVTSTAATTVGTAVSPGIGTAIGMAAGYATGVKMDYKDMQATNRSRKLKFFLDKLNAQEQQKDNFAKLVKDLVLSKVSMTIKAVAPIVGLVLLLLVLLVALVALPVIAIIAVIYNSPFAMFFPSISSGDTMQNVLTAYVAEFDRAVKEVNVVLKTYRDMIAEYGFNVEEQEMLEELMKPEYLAMMGYIGGGGDPSETLSPEQYQAIVDTISDTNGKKVVEYVLSKVGYPYSQDYRDSGEYYDCSSLAYYAWQSAGVSILYEGANTAAAEGKYCYDNSYLVNYDEMQPGDLIFYSYSNNGRFFNITHVAIYVGNGKVVEAANESIGVVYRSVQSRSSIVFIGRPR